LYVSLGHNLLILPTSLICNVQSLEVNSMSIEALICNDKTALKPRFKKGLF
jgi:hypothetical protein